MQNLNRALNNPQFKWLPKHLQHITENIVFKKRNISFLAINALFRQKKSYNLIVSNKENNHFIVEDFVDIQKNDMLRTQAENLTAIFYIDNHDNIIVVTAFSENDSYY
jgi:hypothetical protein